MSRSDTPFNPSRRRLGQALGAGAALAAMSGCATQRVASGGRSLGRVLVVGGGFGGATAASYLKRWGGDSVDVTLVERNRRFVSCPMSNLVLGGSRRIEDLSFDYQGLRARGVDLMHDEVVEIDPVRRRARLQAGLWVQYDQLILSPGVDFLFNEIAGFDRKAQDTVLHAWRAGPQTVALRAQLEAMPDGGTFVMSIPKAPYRCPPGPYERVCQVASYFKTAKPRARIIVLDGNPDIVSKKALFLAAWNGPYKGMIDYRANALVTELDAGTRTLTTELGDRVKGDVLNLIPPQRAGDLANSLGLLNANSRWAQVDWMSMRSTAVSDIHVIGDATFGAPAMPKSGHMANQHGKLAAAAIIAQLNGSSPLIPVMANTCYSFIDDRSAIHIASVHQWVPAKKTLEPVVGAGGLSSAASELEGQYAFGWARNMWDDMLS
jgi:sulfide dehydrogenase [flavocytochrome c] flavoprotein subunit